MKLKELIDKLEDIYKVKGNIEVYFYDYLEEHVCGINGRSLVLQAKETCKYYYDKGDSDIMCDIRQSKISEDDTVLILR